MPTLVRLASDDGCKHSFAQDGGMNRMIKGKESMSLSLGGEEE